ncbi:RNA-binding protein 12B-like isoform X2 [Rhinoderma darwinii]
MFRTVRLEGLSVEANPKDIRLHFAGLEISHEGITIIGGERGVGFLRFTTWEDARRAIQLSGFPIKDSDVNVSPSSTEEKEQALKTVTSSSNRNGVHDSSSRRSQFLRIKATSEVLTPTSVRKFFTGLQITDIVYLKDDRALVKFSNSTDADEGFRRYKNSKDVTVIRSDEREWIKCGGKAHPKEQIYSSSRHERRPHSRSPKRDSHSSSRNSRSPQRHSRSTFSRSKSPLSHSRSSRVKSRSPQRRSKSPQNLPNEHDPIFDGDFYVHVTNLNYASSRHDLCRWFFSRVSEEHIKFLYDEKGRRTRECFVALKNEKDLKKVLRLNQIKFNGRLLTISSITKSSLGTLLATKRALFPHLHSKGKFLYLRNFPSDVTKSDIQKFFAGFSLNEENISLLCNKDGDALGEVMINFLSEKDLEKAEKLHRKKFKDKEIPSKRIPKDKFQSFLKANSLSLMPENPYDCVTQEDDMLEEDSDQEKNTSDEDGQDDNLIPDQDLGLHQTDNAHEFVSQADDAPEDSAVQVDEAPNTECTSSENSIHFDTDDNATLEDATSNDDGLGH